MFAYTVACEFDESVVMDEWIAWLEGEHLGEVCAAGALDAEVIRIDGDAFRCEVRYHFASRSAFETYERDHAPALRQKGLDRFPPERGLRYSRSSGAVAARV